MPVLWWQWNGIRFLEAFLVMLLPTLGMGVSFPLAGKMAVPGLDRLAASLGRLGFWNTLGGVTGSF